MAEIHIEKKTQKPLWPWVLLMVIIVLVALGWWLFNENTEDQLPGEIKINSIEQTVPHEPLAYDATTLLLFNS